jgi:hypothetical protein
MFGVGVDMSSGFILGVGLNMFSEIIIDLSVDVLPDSRAVTLKVIFGVAYAVVDVVTGVPSFVTFGVVPAIDVDMFADENVRGLAAVMTPSEFPLQARKEAMRPFCCR